MNEMSSHLAGREINLGRLDRAMLISIHPRYAQLILSGEKRVELRRRFNSHAVGNRMLIYATLPEAAVVGHVLIEDVQTASVNEIWQSHGKNAMISAEDFAEYFAEIFTGSAVILRNPVKYERPISLEELRSSYGIRAPQSYIYLNESHRELIEHERY